MQYLVDGHNLIPKLGLRLDSIDDEQALVARLQEFCRLKRSKVEVYFDGAPAGFSGMRRSGAVNAHYIRLGSSADAAIEARLTALKRAARNWVVVSSDRRVQNAARDAHAGVLSSEEFTRQVSAAQQQRSLQTKQDAQLSPEDVDEWARFFKDRKS